MLGDTDVSDDSETDDTDPSDDTADTGPDVTWTALPEGCDAPTGLPNDPLVLDGSLKITQDQPGQAFFVELVDLEQDGDIVYGVGQGGLMVYDVSDPTAPALQAVFPDEQAKDRYHKVEVLAPGIVALTHRERHMRVVDLSDKSDLFYQGGKGMEGLAKVGDRLYVSDRDLGLRVMDISDLKDIHQIAVVSGIQHTWELAATGDGWLYAADGVLGLVPIDISDPDAPVIGTPVGLDGSVLHVRSEGDHLLVSNASLGLAIFERSDPAAPTLSSQLTTGGSVVMADASNGLLWAADHEAVTVWDFSDPSDPSPLHRETTEQFALAVIAGPSTDAWVGDWSILGHWTADPAGQAARLELAARDVYLWEDARIVEVRNHGAASGSLLGFSGTDLLVEASATTLGPGETALLRITTTNPIDGSTPLCIAAEDPEDPRQELVVHQGDSVGRLGDEAIDFTLEALDGTEYTLSDYLGQPVMITYFATW